MRYWLFKTEPSEFSIEDLRKAKKQTEPWDGVRNYQARNLLRDEMKEGDRVLFYHSSTKPTAVVGTARITREGYPDHTAFDPKNKHHDPKSKKTEPTWFMVDVTFESEFPDPVTLEELKGLVELKDMMLLRRGARLSVQPVTATEFKAVLTIAKAKAKAVGQPYTQR